MRSFGRSPSRQADARLGLRSQLVVPVPSPNEPAIGLLVVYNSRRLGGFTDRDERLLQALAGYAGAVLDRARDTAARLAAEREAETRRREIEALLTAAERINSAAAPDEVLRRVVGVAAELVGVRHAGISTDEGDHLLRRYDLFDGAWTATPTRVPLDGSIAGWVSRNAKSYRSDHLEGEALFFRQAAIRPDLRVVLAVPIIASTGRNLGVLMLFDPLSGRAFSDDDQRLAEGIAHHAAVALERAALIAELEQRASELQTVLDQLSEAVLVFDHQGQIILTNRLAERWADELHLGPLPGARLTDTLVARNREGVRVELATRLSRADGSALAPEDAAVARALRGESVDDLLVRLKSPAALQPRYLRTTAAPLRDSAGTVVGAVSTTRDITAAYVAGQESQRTERLRATGQLAAGLAHDLNNILGVAVGRTDVILESARARSGVPKEFLDSLGVVRTAMLDAAETVRRLQTFARARDARELSPVRLDQIAHEAASLAQPRWRDEPIAQGRTIRLAKDLSSVPAIEGSPTELREAVLNLILNAVDALPTGGTITLTTREDAGLACISVGDDGAGMTPEVASRIWEPFFTTKQERGTGLGLAMVHGIVERQGGSVSLQTQPGQGTTVSLTFPVQAVAPSTEKPTEAATMGRLLRVLVVDDEPPIRETIAMMLQLLGHTAVEAGSAEEAFGRLDRQTVDLVLTDHGMPGMTGMELGRAIHRRIPGLPIVLLTGWGKSLSEVEVQEVTGGRLASKPLTLAALRELVAWAGDRVRAGN